MNNSPYKKLPDKAFWKRSIAEVEYAAVDPVIDFKLQIENTTKVATAGSCFAQHIARHLKQSGFNYYVAERGHPVVPGSVLKRHGYGLFSCRYGNIYTARQLLQLFQRAYGTFNPVEKPWVDDSGVKDPFRPTVQPDNFISIDEMLADRKQHLAYVREMFENLDVFVFTLGLTECWVSANDGAAFPMCPGVSGGIFSHEKYLFYNQKLAEVVSDLNSFFEALKVVNPKASMILTVSPVPLVATAEKNQHVLSATTYSKSVLRVAAQEIVDRYSDVHYFPSYEIITGSYNRGRYFADDLRSVTEEGVSHVMSLFLKHATSFNAVGGIKPSHSEQHKQAKTDSVLAAAQKVIDLECDEVALDAS